MAMGTFQRRSLLLAGTATLLAASLGFAGSAARSQDPSTIRIDGSSTVFPITEAVAEEFQRDKRGSVRVTVGISGTGGGFEKFCNGETDISNASRPIKDSEVEACAAEGIDFIELPVAYDALTVVIHPENDWATEMTVEELRTMWAAESEGEVTLWSDIRPGWPDEEFDLFGPGADSGTFDYFTEEIIDGDSRTDYTPSEDDNVLVQGIAGDRYALGYFGYAYYEANQGRLQSVAVNGVKPSAATVNDGTYTPLSRPIYIYVSTEAAERPEIQEFVEYYLTEGPDFVSEVAYVPLPSEDYSAAMDRFRSRETGRVALREGL